MFCLVAYHFDYLFYRPPKILWVWAIGMFGLHACRVTVHRALLYNGTPTIYRRIDRCLDL